MLKPDHAQARLRRLAAAIIMAAPLERVLLQWNQFMRQTRFAPSHAPRPAAARLIFAQIGQARLALGRADRHRSCGYWELGSAHAL